MTEHPGAGGELPWPEYDYDIPEVFDAYMHELTGTTMWDRFPATFRWHEFWERLGKAVRVRALTKATDTESDR